MMGWYAHKSGGALYGGAASLNGSALAYVFLASVNSAVGSYSTLSVNIADFTRYAKGPRSQYIQIVMIPVFFIVGCMMGIVIASGAQAVNGGAVEFNPLVVMQGWENRSALFFGGFSMMMSSLGSNSKSLLLTSLMIQLSLRGTESQSLAYLHNSSFANLQDSIEEVCKTRSFTKGATSQTRRSDARSS